MNSKTIGFIGCGNMGGAMIGGILQAGLTSAERILVSDLNEAKLKEMTDKYGVATTTDAREVAEAADYLILAVKPNVYAPVIASIKDLLTPKKVLVSIAAGQSLAAIAKLAGTEVKVVRVMPNTPALVEAGMAAVCPNDKVGAQELADVEGIFASFGLAEVVPEYLIDGVVGISGSSPAYAFIFIEALADAGVLAGLPRQQAYRFAAQSLYGSAKMVLETGKHPGELKDMVCSPGGTTIEAVAALEASGFRSAVIKAVNECVAKSKAMSEKE